MGRQAGDGLGDQVRPLLVGEAADVAEDEVARAEAEGLPDGGGRPGAGQVGRVHPVGDDGRRDAGRDALLDAPADGHHVVGHRGAAVDDLAGPRALAVGHDDAQARGRRGQPLAQLPRPPAEQHVALAGRPPDGVGPAHLDRHAHLGGHARVHLLGGRGDALDDAHPAGVEEADQALEPVLDAGPHHRLADVRDPQRAGRAGSAARSGQSAVPPG